MWKSTSWRIARPSHMVGTICYSFRSSKLKIVAVSFFGHYATIKYQNLESGMRWLWWPWWPKCPWSKLMNIDKKMYVNILWWLNMDKMDENGWLWTKMDNNGWKWIKMDDGEWQWVRVDENELWWMKMDNNGWKWIMVDENGWTWTTVEENG